MPTTNTKDDQDTNDASSFDQYKSNYLSSAETITIPTTNRHHHIANKQQYQDMYTQSINDPDLFWKIQALKELDWFQPFTHTKYGSFEKGDVAWFLNGKLNVCYNCIDRHILAGKGDKPAIIFESDDEVDSYSLTFSQVFEQICQFSNFLKSQLSISKGQVICIYMPMIPQLCIAMLSCARLGIIHNVVFAGFSSSSLSDRIIFGKCKTILTSTISKRGGKHIQLESIAKEAITKCADKEWYVENLVVYHNEAEYQITDDQVPYSICQSINNNNINISASSSSNAKTTNASSAADSPSNSTYKLHNWNVSVQNERPYCPCEVMDSEDPLFILFTSGSTGQPKGIQHSSAGYLLYSMMTCKYVFDLHDDDIHGCVADCGWITGTSYIVYGPLSNGTTTLMFESIPTYPTPARYWQMVQKHKLTTFYLSPTALRHLMKFDVKENIETYDLSSLRVLGSVGEPISPESWRWFHQHIGKSKIPIVDTYWQTETSGFLIAPFPFAIQQKAGSATLPFFGIEPSILDGKTGQITSSVRDKPTQVVSGTLCISSTWPGIARTIWGDHSRFIKTYMSQYPGHYLTGDGAIRDLDGYYWITGRIDDVVNVSGHRISSAEIESAIVSLNFVAESACVGIPHDVKGQSLFVFVTLKDIQAQVADVSKQDLKNQFRMAVRKHIGAFAVPDEILISPNFPKTRSGKIMRRILRKIAENTTDVKDFGDLSTLAEPNILPTLIQQVQQLRKNNKTKTNK